MFGVFPNHTTVEGAREIAPTTTRERFTMAVQNSFDPYLFPFVGFVAGLNDATSHDESWGHGAAGYGKRYAAALADNTIGNFLTTAVVSSLLGQDPRYFQSGQGSALHRMGYAAGRSVITRGSSGHRQFNVSEIGGNAVAAEISSLYYPGDAGSLSDVLTRWGMQVMWDTLSNELKEFWPDIRRKMHKK
jgi:hypothetical protein